MRSLGYALNHYDWCPYKRKFGHTKRHVYTERWLCECTGRLLPSTSQEERLQKKPTLPTPWSQTSGLQNCEKMNVFFNHSVVFCYGSPSKLNMKLYCSTELHRKDTLPMRFTRKCSLFHPNSAFLSQSTSFSRYSVHSSGRLNTTFQRCPCPNARASKYISLYDKGALQM